MFYDSVSMFFWNLNEMNMKSETVSWAYRKQTLLWLQRRQNVTIRFCLIYGNLSIYILA